MDFSLSDEQKELRDAVLDFAREELDPAPEGESGDPEFRRDRWQKCADFGLLGLPVPREYGGQGRDPLSVVLALEALGRGCGDQGLAFSLEAHLLSVVVPLVEFGTDAQKERYLPGLHDGSLIGAHAMSEPDSGSDAFSLRTRAERDGDRYVLDGRKTFVTNAPVADLFLVFATVNRERGYWGVTAFLVEDDAAGLSVSSPLSKMGLTSSPMAEVALTDCRVPADRRLGSEGQGGAIFQHSMAWERSCILASQVGAMERQLEECVEYARQRRQFGKPIGEFQMVASRIADMKVRLEASRLLLYRAAWSLEEENRGDGSEGPLAKLYVSEASVRSSLDAVQLHGGYGYMEEFDVERDMRDAVGGTLYSGTSDIQKLIIARTLGLDPD